MKWPRSAIPRFRLRKPLQLLRPLALTSPRVLGTSRPFRGVDMPAPSPSPHPTSTIIRRYNVLIPPFLPHHLLSRFRDISPRTRPRTSRQHNRRRHIGRSPSTDNGPGPILISQTLQSSFLLGRNQNRAQYVFISLVPLSMIVHADEPRTP